MITIVTPTLNSGKTLGATIESVRQLVANGAEHIIVDSASSDNTLNIARDHNIRTIQIAPGNMYAAINYGLKYAKNDWLTYLNGDDIIYSDSLENGMKKLTEYTDIIYGNIDYIDSEGRFMHSWRSPNEKDLKAIFAAGVNPIPQQGTIFRRDLYLKLDGFNEDLKLGADYDFYIRAHKQGAVFFKNRHKTVAGFRLSPNQMSQKHAMKMQSEIDISYKRHISNRFIVGKMRGMILFKIRNLGNYLIRILRHKELSGCYKINRTIY